MADYPHVYKTIDKMLGSEWGVGDKVWSHPRSNAFKMSSEPNLTRYKDYALEKVPIDDLIKNIDYSSLGEREDWQTNGVTDPTKFVYDPKKDNNPLHIINATRKSDGSYQVNEGRHRLIALKNGGYTHAVIPIYDEFVNSNQDFKDVYWKEPNEKMPLINRQINLIQKHHPDLYKTEDLEKLKARLKTRSPYVDFLINGRKYIK